MKPTPASFLAVVLQAASSFAQTTPPSTPAQFPVTVTVDAAQATGPLRTFWRYFGADEPNYATMKDGQKLLSQLGELAPKQVYFRAHNLLTSGDGTPAFKWGSTNAVSLLVLEWPAGR